MLAMGQAVEVHSFRTGYPQVIHISFALSQKNGS